jgi:alpha-glucosidase (family GH31 glycosyl hydrolase)
VIDYPEDRNVWGIQDQYLFGDSLLIAPILRPLSESNRRNLYLPKGTWIDYWTKTCIASRGEWIERTLDLKTMPIYAKTGSILPYGESRLCTHNSIGPIVELEIYAGSDGRLEYEDGEKSFIATWGGNQLSLSGLTPEPRVVVYGENNDKA